MELTLSTRLSFPALLALLCLFPLRLKAKAAGPAALPRSPAVPCNPAAGYGFCDRGASPEARARDLVSRLTLSEKVQQLVDKAAGVPRLGVPEYEWWSEALHGVSDLGPGTGFHGASAAIPAATQFPQVIHSAATFNATLWRAVGSAVSTEARAMFNAGQAGLTFWSPNVNVFRDPRWGRGQETPGEDPLVVSRYGVEYVRGLQEDDAGGGGGHPERLKVAACCKHFTAYDLDNWNGVVRQRFDAVVTAQDLADTYNPPFRSCVMEGRVASVMCSYNQVNGVPTCASKSLLQDTIRGQWRLQGYISSDCDSVDVLFRLQNYTRTPEEAAADALNAGLNLNCGKFLALHTEAAVRAGLVQETVVDQALLYNYATLVRLGWFDGAPSAQSFGHLSARGVCTDEHRELALDAARQGAVLLRNDRNVLPLSPSAGTVAVIGPNANASFTMIGDYHGVPCGYATPVDGVAKYARTVYEPGCPDVLCADGSLVSAATDAAAKADATVLVVGGDQTLETEAHDRTSLRLPGFQERLVAAVTAAARKGPVVLVVMSGGPFDISFAANVSAVLWFGYPGELGGQAMADVIFGEYNPGGKLPVTWYPEEYSKIPMTNMNMRPDVKTGYPGRTYRFYTGPTVFDFGHGLSYTTFTHTLLSLNFTTNEQQQQQQIWCTRGYGHRCSAVAVKPAALCRNDRGSPTMEVVVVVENTGHRVGTETVLLFWGPAGRKVPAGAPRKELLEFAKVWVQPGAPAHVHLSVDVCSRLRLADDAGMLRFHDGVYTISTPLLPRPHLLTLSTV